MSKGKRKPKLRDYSLAVLTPEERKELRDVFASVQQYPIVTAILGCVFVEQELEFLLRRRFKDDTETWAKLTDERGPLGSFAQKITLGRALRIYDAKFEHDLNVVRKIRNAFAHSKKILKFNDPLIIDELRSAHPLRASLRKGLAGFKDEQLCQSAYIIICLVLATRLLAKLNRLYKVAGKRRLKKLSPLAQVLARAGQRSPPHHSQPHQSADPSRLAPLGSLGEQLQALSKLSDKKDK